MKPDLKSGLGMSMYPHLVTNHVRGIFFLYSQGEKVSSILGLCSCLIEASGNGGLYIRRLSLAMNTINSYLSLSICCSSAYVGWCLACSVHSHHTVAIAAVCLRQ